MKLFTESCVVERVDGLTRCCLSNLAHCDGTQHLTPRALTEFRTTSLLPGTRDVRTLVEAQVPDQRIKALESEYGITLAGRFTPIPATATREHQQALQEAKERAGVTAGHAVADRLLRRDELHLDTAHAIVAKLLDGR
jgi:hypothetical protein